MPSQVKNIWQVFTVQKAVLNDTKINETDQLGKTIVEDILGSKKLLTENTSLTIEMKPILPGRKLKLHGRFSL